MPLVSLIVRRTCGCDRTRHGRPPSRASGFQEFHNLKGRRSGSAGGDRQANVAGLAQFLHNTADLLSTRSLWVENKFGVVRDYQHLLEVRGGGRGIGSSGLSTSGAGDLRELAEKNAQKAGNWSRWMNHRFLNLSLIGPQWRNAIDVLPIRPTPIKSNGH